MRAPLFLTAGFRFFFLAAGLWAVVAMALWLSWLGGQAGWPVPAYDGGGTPTLWHAHEMIFGYALATVSGFFLTAVPNWTGDRSAPVRFVATVGSLWLAGRLAMLGAAHLPPGLVAAADLVFLPVLAARLARSLLRTPKSQNMLFLALLAVCIAGNLAMHAEWLGWTGGTAGQGARAALLAVLAMIVIIGGRIVPAFTRNALLRAGETRLLPVHRPWAERLAIWPALAVPVLAGLNLPVIGDMALAAAAGLAFVGNAARIQGWRSRATLGDPLLAVLHGGFALTVLAYLALALASGVGWPDELVALHLAGVGAIGTMTLAMMTRAALGHTGRALAAPAGARIAYGLVALALALRVAAGMHSGSLYLPLAIAAAIAWIAAFGAFLAAYLPILAGPDARRQAAPHLPPAV